MARAFSINAKDVEEAAAELERQNKPITPHRIKTVLGKGRLSTIAYFLTATKYGGVKQTDDPLTQRLVALLYPLAQELIEESEDKIQVKTLSLEKEVKSLKQSLSLKDEAISSLEEKLSCRSKEAESLTESVQTLTEENHQHEALIDKQATSISHLEKRLQEAKAQEDKASKKHEEAIAALNKHQLSALNQKDDIIDLLKQSIEAETKTKESYKSEARLLNDQLNAEKLTLSKLRDDLLTYQESLTATESQNAELDATINELQHKLSSLELSLSEKDDQHQADTKEIHQLKDDISNHENQKQRMQAIETELEETKTKLAYSESLFQQLGGHHETK